MDSDTELTMHTQTTLFSSALLSLSLLAACDGAAPSTPAVSPEAPSAAESAPKTVALPAGTARPNSYWWPDQVNLDPLRRNADTNPYGSDFDYAAAFEALDLAAVKADIAAVLTDSQDWWPADYGSYGPLFVRLAWHSAGTYRMTDGRGGSDGGQIRFEPQNSWPDNANLDKARRLLWPIKQKYGSSLSWADLMVLSGNVALESSGFETLGFSGGRTDDWEADLVYWGPEAEMLADARFHGDRELQEPLAAVQMGLIYVNPQGPGGNNDPLSAAKDIRTTFGAMGMNDEETVALIAGGHTLGKAHGAHDPGKCVGVEPAAEGVEAQGTGWHNTCGSGAGADTVTSGLEGAWTSTPVSWSPQYLTNLHNFDWEQTQSPAGATQWKPTSGGGEGTVPDAHDSEKRHAPIMFTTDLSMREDPAYGAISKRFMENPAEFDQAFAEAWFKLTHRDMGPHARYIGPEVPEEVFSWQSPVPAVDHPLITASDAAILKSKIMASGLSVSALVRVAWASASTYRDTDMRGGANGARIRLAPQRGWSVNDPAEVSTVLSALEEIQSAFNTGTKKVSLADLVVLGGAAAIEQAADSQAVVAFSPGRTDASVEQTDAASIAYLEPKADGFRNHYTDDALRRPSDALIDKADRLGLTVPEMTALVGGLRVLSANAGGSSHGVFTDSPGTLSNDFFVNLLDLTTSWQPGDDGVFEGSGPDGQRRWTATEADLVFGSNSELRAVCEVYAYDEAKFFADFSAAWVKVMQADRFDLHR